MSQLIQTLQQTIGAPTKTEQDPRKGITAIWGSREQGAFAVFRGPIDSKYEVSLIAAPDSQYENQVLSLSEIELVV